MDQGKLRSLVMNERIRELESQCWEERKYGPTRFTIVLMIHYELEVARLRKD